jgi:hypothetical protein
MKAINYESDDETIHLLFLECGGGLYARTDIDANKMTFRNNDWVKKFVEVHGLKAGDQVVVERTSEDSYKLYPKS